MNATKYFILKKSKLNIQKKWYEKTKRYAKIVSGEAKKYANINKININNAMPQYIKDWIKQVQYFIENQDKFEENNISKYIA